MTGGCVKEETDGDKWHGEEEERGERTDSDTIFPSLFQEKEEYLQVLAAVSTTVNRTLLQYQYSVNVDPYEHDTCLCEFACVFTFAQGCRKRKCDYFIETHHKGRV